MTKNGPIIILEDDADDQELFRMSFIELGIANEILFFLMAKEALHYLETTTGKPFLILSDINLPVMNGFEFRQYINDNEFLRKKSIPFIFFSTAASPATVNKAYEMTVQGFFIKEISFTGLKKTLGLIIEYWSKCRHPNYG